MKKFILISPKNRTVYNFRGDLIRAFQDVGFIYHAEVCIWKNPVTAMQRTKALGLLHKQLKKDSCMSRMGIPDYVVFMRKPGDNTNRVTHTNESFPVSEWQLPVIERCLRLYSNEGDVVFTPFLGIGSEVYQAVKMKRKGIGIELKPAYFEAAVTNVKMAEMEMNQTTLFDFIEGNDEGAEMDGEQMRIG